MTNYNLDDLLNTWYNSDPDYFDTMMTANSQTLAQMAWSSFMSCLDDGDDLTSACDGFFSHDQIVFIYNTLAPLI
jgi:hypothetical protein